MTATKNNMPDEEKDKTCDCTEKCNCGCLDDKDCTCHEDTKKTSKDNCSETCECEDISNEQIEEKQEIKEGYYLDLAKRVQADFDNYRKRTVAELSKVKYEGMVTAIETILPALDAFKKAIQIVKDEDSLNGIKMIKKDILNALRTLGVEPIEAKGKKFDPNFHDAIAMLPSSELEDGIIIEEAQTGYTLSGKVIRYSQVVVTKNGN